MPFLSAALDSVTLKILGNLSSSRYGEKIHLSGSDLEYKVIQGKVFKFETNYYKRLSP
jgi:hypothetical protein